MQGDTTQQQKSLNNGDITQALCGEMITGHRVLDLQKQKHIPR